MATSAPARDTVGSSARGGAPAARRRWRLPFSPWHLVLIPATIVLIFPFVWLVITSVQTPAEALHFPPVLIPHQIRLANYPDALKSAPFGRFFVNSAIVAVVTVLSNLVLCSLAGYAFARFRFLGRTALFAVIMATLMVPFQVTMIPQFIITKWLGVHVLAAVGINHIGALILPNAATAFGIFFLRQFFRTLPLEYEESARVDGARRLSVLVVAPHGVHGGQEEWLVQLLDATDRLDVRVLMLTAVPVSVMLPMAPGSLNGVPPPAGVAVDVAPEAMVTAVNQ